MNCEGKCPFRELKLGSPIIPIKNAVIVVSVFDSAVTEAKVYTLSLPDLWYCFSDYNNIYNDLWEMHSRVQYSCLNFNYLLLPTAGPTQCIAALLQ